MNKKKLLALLMALVMTLSLIPTTVWADDTPSSEPAGPIEGYDAEGGTLIGTYDTLKDAIDAEGVYYVKLTAAISESNITLNTKDLTLDLNGQAVNATNANNLFMSVGNDHTLTIKDSAGGGVIQSTANSGGLFFAAGGGATVVLESGEIELYTGGSSNTVFGGVNGSIVAEIKGGIVETDGAVADGSGCNIIISGGQIKGAGFSSFLSQYIGGYCTVSIIGGTFYKDMVDTANNTIGGKAVHADYKIVEDTDLGSNWYKVVSAAVAQIGNTGYETLESAIAAAQAGDTVELLKDFTLSNYVTVPDGKTVKLDYKGYTITSELADSYAPIENYGTLTVVDTSAGKTGGIAGVNRCINNYGTLNVGTGDFDASTKTTSNKVFGGNYSTTNLTGGTAIQNKSDDGTMNFYDCIVNAMNYGVYNMGIANVYGGTFNGASCSACRSNWFYTFSSEGTLNIYDATITGVHGALSIDGGSANVYAGTFLAHECQTKAGNKHTNVGSGVHYALYVAGEKEVVECNVYGGTFSSDSYNSVVDIGNNAKGDGGNRLPATCHIKGGTFTKTGMKGKAIISVDTTLGNLELTGGTFTGFDAAQATAFNTRMTNGNYVADGYALNQTSDVTYEVVATYVAETAGTQYATVEAAIADAANNGTVTLLTDASLTGETTWTLEKSITLDLAGHTLTAKRINLNKGGLNVVTSVAGGTVTSSGQTFNVYGSETNAANYTTLTIGEGVTVNGNYAVCLFPVNNMTSYGATINVNGTLTGTKGTVFVSGNLGNSAETGAALASSANISVINVGATAEITSSGDQAIAMNGMAKVNVADGAKLTGREAIGLKRGILNIAGGTFRATGTKVETVVANNSGTEETGAALSITSTYNYAGRIELNISGGSFESEHGLAFLAAESFKNETPNAFASGNPILNITGGKYDDDSVKEYVAPGYEAVAIEDGWYQVGEITTTGVAQSDTEDGFDATFSAKKTVTSTDDLKEELASEKSLSVNIKASGSNTAETNRAASYKLDKVVEDAIGAANNTNETNLDVTIEVVRDTPAVVENKITYEVHPQATVKSGNDTVGTFIVTNDKLADNAVFTIKLPVPAELVTESGKVQVTHIRDGVPNEVFQLTVEGTNDDRYVTISGITSFSQFELAPISAGDYQGVAFTYSLDLRDSININFYVDLSEATDKTIGNYTVQYLYKGSNWTNATREPVDANNYRYVVAQCAAKEMTEPVHVRVLYNGAIIKSADYTVKGYCDYTINEDTTATPALTELCRRVLDFGAAAQVRFNYNTDNLASISYADNLAGVSIPAGPVAYAAKNGVSAISATVNLESRTGVVIYFTPTSVVTGYSVTRGGSALSEDTDYTVTTLSNGNYMFVVNGISARDLNQSVIIDFYTEAGTSHIEYSPLVYAYNKQYNASVGNLCKALYRYWDAAYNYFG